MAKSEGKSPKQPFHFEGFETPHFTQVPDQLFDVLMTGSKPETGECLTAVQASPAPRFAAGCLG